MDNRREKKLDLNNRVGNEDFVFFLTGAPFFKDKQSRVTSSDFVSPSNEHPPTAVCFQIVHRPIIYVVWTFEDHDMQEYYIRLLLSGHCRHGATSIGDCIGC